jgi:hypothetical protein
MPLYPIHRIGSYGDSFNTKFQFYILEVVSELLCGNPNPATFFLGLSIAPLQYTLQGLARQQICEKAKLRKPFFPAIPQFARHHSL